MSVENSILSNFPPSLGASDSSVGAVDDVVCASFDTVGTIDVFLTLSISPPSLSLCSIATVTCRFRSGWNNKTVLFLVFSDIPHYDSRHFNLIGMRQTLKYIQKGLLGLGWFLGWCGMYRKRGGEPTSHRSFRPDAAFLAAPRSTWWILFLFSERKGKGWTIKDVERERAVFGRRKNDL